VSRSDGRHVENLSLDELDARIRCEDSNLEHTIAVVDRQKVRLKRWRGSDVDGVRIQATSPFGVAECRPQGVLRQDRLRGSGR
jgi:hypothetical protein